MKIAVLIAGEVLRLAQLVLQNTVLENILRRGADEIGTNRRILSLHSSRRLVAVLPARVGGFDFIKPFLCAIYLFSRLFFYRRFVALAAEIHVVQAQNAAFQAVDIRPHIPNLG